MSPQPLDKYCADCKLHLHRWSMRRTPDMVRAAMEFVLMESYVDDSLTRFVSEKLIEADFTVIGEFLAALPNKQRRDLISKAAQAVLPDEDWKVFERVHQIVGENAYERAKFAHWLWCTIERKDGRRPKDAIALVRPRDLTREHARIFAAPPGPEKLTIILSGPQPDAEVWTKDEIEEMVTKSDRALTLVRGLMLGVGSPRDDQLHDVLRAELGLPQLRSHPRQTPPQLP